LSLTTKTLNLAPGDCLAERLNDLTQKRIAGTVTNFSEAKSPD
jgi:hypothetical protein